MIPKYLRVGALALLCAITAPAFAASDEWSASTLVADGDAHAGHAEYGPAILAYERAQLLAPRDGRIAAKLAHAREEAGLTPRHVSRMEAALSLLTSDGWATIALIGGTAACLGLVLLAWTRARRSVLVAGIATGAVVAVITGAASVRAAPDRSRAVVLSAQTARIAPVDTAEDAFVAHAGEDVRIEQRRNDLVFVRTRSGDRGWLASAAVEPLIPRARFTPRS